MGDISPSLRVEFEAERPYGETFNGLYVVRSTQTVRPFFVERVLAPICGYAALLKFSLLGYARVSRLICLRQLKIACCE